MELFSLLAKLVLDTNEFEKGIDKAESDLKSLDVSDPQLGIDNGEFNEGIAESQSLGDGFGSDMERVFQGIKNALTTTGIAATIYKMVDSLKQAVEMTAETADGIEKGAAKLGISQKAYQEWDHALKQSGASIDVVKKGIMQFQAAIVAANPKTPFADAEDAADGLADKTAGLSEDAKKALGELELLDDLTAGKFSGAEELMNATLLKLAEFDVSTEEGLAERGTLVRKLFGKGGDELNALLNEGKEGVKALLTEASDLGLIMSDEEIANATAYGDAVDNLNAELQAIQQAFVKDVIPILKDAVEWATEILSLFNPRNSKPTLVQQFDEIDKSLATNVQNLERNEAKAKSLLEQLGALGDYNSLDEKGKKSWESLANELITLFPELDKVISTDTHTLKLNTDEISKNIAEWTRLEEQRLIDESLVKKKQAIAQQYVDAMDKEIEADNRKADADAEWVLALEKINELRKQHGLEAFEEGTTYEQYMQWYNEYGKNANQRNYKQLGLEDFSNATKGYEGIIDEVESLREKAQEMNDEAVKMEGEYQRYAEKLSEKLGITIDDTGRAKTAVEKFQDSLDSLPDSVRVYVETMQNRWHSNAIGSAYIPYDNYPTLLHRGEKVLTATEARQSNEIDYSALEDRITAAIRSGMDGVTVNSYLNGKAITDEVNRNTINDVKNRRYRT